MQQWTIQNLPSTNDNCNIIKPNCSIAAGIGVTERVEIVYVTGACGLHCLMFYRLACRFNYLVGHCTLSVCLIQLIFV